MSEKKIATTAAQEAAEEQVVRNEDRYVCPYCGVVIKPEDVLFYASTTTQRHDSIRTDFLSKHGMSVSRNATYDRVYFKQSEESELEKVDDNGFPFIMKAKMSSGVGGDELGIEKKETSKSSRYDDDNDDDLDRGRGRSAAVVRSAAPEDEPKVRIPGRACPKCHCALPKNFGVLPIHHVALFGGRASGKTAYIISLFQKVEAELAKYDLGAIVVEEESRKYLEQITGTYEADGTTAATEKTTLMPIVFLFRYKNQQCYITVYDIAGEATKDDYYMANHRGIALCETLLLMIDPNMFNQGKYTKETNANRGIKDTGHDYCDETIDSFFAQAGYLCTEYATNVKRIICVITKLDLLLEMEKDFFSSGNVEVINDCGMEHLKHVNLPVLQNVQKDIETFLKNKFHISLKEKLKDNFGADVKVNILAVSTAQRNTGKGPKGISFEKDPVKNAKKDSQKHRIIEPFLVILMSIGLVPALTKEGKIVVFKGAQENVIGEEQQAPEAGKKPAKKSAKDKKPGFFARLFGRKNK